MSLRWNFGLQNDWWLILSQCVHLAVSERFIFGTISIRESIVDLCLFDRVGFQFGAISNNGTRFVIQLGMWTTGRTPEVWDRGEWIGVRSTPLDYRVYEGWGRKMGSKNTFFDWRGRANFRGEKTRILIGEPVTWINIESISMCLYGCQYKKLV